MPAPDGGGRQEAGGLGLVHLVISRPREPDRRGERSRARRGEEGGALRRARAGVPWGAGGPRVPARKAGWRPSSVAGGAPGARRRTADRPRSAARGPARSATFVQKVSVNRRSTSSTVPRPNLASMPWTPVVDFHSRRVRSGPSTSRRTVVSTSRVEPGPGAGGAEPEALGMDEVVEFGLDRHVDPDEAVPHAALHRVAPGAAHLERFRARRARGERVAVLQVAPDRLARRGKFRCAAEFEDHGRRGFESGEVCRRVHVGVGPFDVDVEHEVGSPGELAAEALVAREPFGEAPGVAVEQDRVARLVRGASVARPDHRVSAQLPRRGPPLPRRRAGSRAGPPGRSAPPPAAGRARRARRVRVGGNATAPASGSALGITRSPDWRTSAATPSSPFRTTAVAPAMTPAVTQARQSARSRGRSAGGRARWPAASGCRSACRRRRRGGGRAGAWPEE